MNPKSEHKSHFWPSYVDLMTSLFIVTLVLFILSYIRFSNINKALQASARQMERIKEIERALNQLDHRYFHLDAANNRYKLLVEVSFAPNKSDIHTISPEQLAELDKAGGILYNKMKQLAADKKINYLLIIEGHAEKTFYHGRWNYDSNPDRGYSLSYERALALKNYWKQIGFDFNQFANCEILTVGSGYFGKSRDSIEANNKRFTIQITPKFKLD